MNLRTIIEDLKRHAVTYGVLSIVLQAVFFRESISVVQRFLASFYWMFLLPGAFLLMRWRERWGFTERLIAGSALSLAAFGVLSYHLGLLGLHVRLHGLLLPPLFIAAGLLLARGGDRA